MLRLVSIAALALALVAAPRAIAYHYFEAGSGGCRWAAIGAGNVDFAVDASSTASIGAALLAESIRARDRWNDVDTARDVLGDFSPSSVDFTDANFGTAWGVGFAASGPAAASDGRNEIALDETGAILALFGLDPADVAGFSATRRAISGGTCTITDAFHLLNDMPGAFDRESTTVHELGHLQGLAHSSVGQSNSRNSVGNAGVYASPGIAFDVVAIEAVPTMHPFSAGTGAERRTLERDDIAGLSALYPEPAFEQTLGAVEGTVTRCLDGAPVVGAAVRAIGASPAVQASRYSAFDGNGEGRYRIDGLPPGDYRIVVEPVGANGFTKARLSLETDADAGFVTEYYGPTAAAEDGCSESLPDGPLAVTVTAGAVTANVDIRVEGVDLALVVDDTGSMSQELLAIGQVVDEFGAAVVAAGAPFPNVGLLTYKDDVTLRTVTDDPGTLRAAVSALSSQGGLDCPESAHAALLSAGRMLRDGGRSILFTDAGSRPDGPTTSAVQDYYRSRALTASFVLSHTCSIIGFARGSGAAQSRSGGAGAAAGAQCQGAGCEPVPVGAPGVEDEFAEPDVLGRRGAIDTYAEIASETGGVFRGLPRPAGADVQRYVDYAVGLGLASVGPSVGLVTPADAPAGAVLEVSLVGLGTHWDGSSRVTFAPGITVTDVTVESPTSLSAELAIDAAAWVGASDVVVETSLDRRETETAVGLGLLDVRPSAGTELVSVLPARGTPSQTLDLRVRGFGTSFDATSTVSISFEIVVNDVAVDGPESLVANVSIPFDATPGFYPVSVRTRSRVVSKPSAFHVVPSVAPRVDAVSPPQAVRGQAVDVTIRGRNTSFEDGASAVRLGAGVAVTQTTVTAEDEVVARVEVAPDALLGYRDVRVTTADEVAVRVDGFRVASTRLLEDRDELAVCIEPGGRIQLLADVSEPFARFQASIAPDRAPTPLSVELSLSLPSGDTLLLGRSREPGGKVKSGHVSLLVAGEHVVRVADAGGRGGCFTGRFRIDDRNTGRAAATGCVPPAAEEPIRFDAAAGQTLRAKIGGMRGESGGALLPVAALVAPSGARTDLPSSGRRGLRIRDVPLAETGVYELAIGSADGLGGCYRAKLRVR